MTDVLQRLTDPATAYQALGAGGVADGIDAKAQRFADAALYLLDEGATGAGAAWFVPGRIEVLGKHTDYCGGRSLVAAAERGICLVAAARRDSQVRVRALDRDQGVQFTLGPDLQVQHGDWCNYPMTVARRLARNFPEACDTGAEIAFGGDLPPAAGMSSSSALIVATYLALAEVNEVEGTQRFRAAVADDLARAEYLGTHENGQSYGDLNGDLGVGTFGGSEDHTAILCSQAGSLGQFRYCPTRLERRVPVPPGYTFVIGVSGVVAEKTGAAQGLYNRASLRARALVDAWCQATGSGETYLADVLGGSAEAGQRLREVVASGHGDFTADELRLRLEHFEKEDGLIDAAGDALTAGDVGSFGDCVDRSQTWTDRLLGNQVPETIHLARSARTCGAAAASAFGAGFGGSVWALVAAADSDQFRRDWSAASPASSSSAGSRQFFGSGAGPAAIRVA